MNYSKSGWQKEVIAITGGKGVDVIYDPVGLINGGAYSHILPMGSNVSHRCLKMYRLERSCFSDRVRCRHH